MPVLWVKPLLGLAYADIVGLHLLMPQKARDPRRIFGAQGNTKYERANGNQTNDGSAKCGERKELSCHREVILSQREAPLSHLPGFVAVPCVTP
jgi:hypothetical protein